MPEGQTSIDLTWNKRGTLSYRISGVTLPSPRNDPELWVLAPSASLYLCHQLGVFEPAGALDVCDRIADLLAGKKYKPVPINKTLKSARLSLVYIGDGSAGIQFFPKHPLVHNSAQLEEGQRQLLTNYFNFVYTRFSPAHKLPILMASCAVMGAYLTFLSEIIESGLIDADNLRWNSEFSKWSGFFARLVSEKYAVLDREDESWIQQQTHRMQDELVEIRHRHSSVSKRLGLK